MGTIRHSNTITGTLDGIAHTVTGTSTQRVNGYRVDSFNLTTAYTEIPYSTGFVRLSVLIYNDGADEIYVRMQSVSGPSWAYCMIPVGAAMEFHAGAEDFAAMGSIHRMDIKAQTSTSRAIVHQVWF